MFDIGEYFGVGFGEEYGDGHFIKNGKEEEAHGPDSQWGDPGRSSRTCIEIVYHILHERLQNILQF